MTSNYHTPIPSGAAANAQTFNDPLGQMDQALSNALLVQKDGHIIQDEGVDLAQQQRLNFVGSIVSVTNDGPNGRTVVTIDSSGLLAKTGLTEWDEQGSNPSTPATNKWKLYFKSDGLYLIEDTGTVVGPIDIRNYLAKTGLTEWDEQAGDPSTPAANKWKVYFKAGGLYIKDDAGNVIGPVGSGGGGDQYPMEFRLTPQTANPMPGTGITSTTLYAAQFQGNQIALYTGGAWVTRTSAEFSLALGTMTTDLPYDIFCYDNSGTPTLEKLAWTNGTTRATALALQDGVYVKSGDATRRYLGTIRPSTTTQIKTLATRYDVWNYYNQVPTILGILNTTNHTYSTATWRAWNNDLANSSVSFVLGLAQNCIAVYRGRITAATGGGIGFNANSTTAPNGTKGEQFNNVADVSSSDMFSFSPGSNYWCAVEYGTLTTERVSLTLQVMM